MYAGPTTLNEFFRLNDPKYRDGYEDGYKAAQEEVTAKFEKILKGMQPFQEATSTG